MSKYEVKKNEAPTMDYDLKVLSAKITAAGKVTFNLLVNGVTIYFMSLIEYKNKDGEEGTFISFPQYASNKTDENGNKVYLNYAWFTITKEMKEEIIAQIDAILK